MFNKKAIVTGAGGGIGSAIAKELLSDGCTVIITDISLKSLDPIVNQFGDSAIPMVWDASAIGETKTMMKTAIDKLGGLDILVNNAGIFARRNEWGKDDLLETSIEEWESVLKINTSAVFFMMQSAIKYMRNNNVKGHILNIASASAFEPVFGAYGASKSTVVQLTRGWGKMFADEGITINGIAPGPVATAMNNWHEGDSLSHSRVPFGRFATTQEIAKLAMYLLSDEAKMVCGETIILDGAYSIR